MKQSKATKIIAKTAAVHGTSVAEVRAGIQSTLDYAYANNGNDPFWSKWNGKKPTLEQFIVSVSDDVLARFAESKDRNALLQ